jgi:hypothetical protein
MVAVAIIGAGVVGAGATAYAASNAADAQSAAADKASQTQLQMANQSAALQKAQYDQTRTDLLPYSTNGAAASNMLTGQLSNLTSPIKMDQATLEQTPGYQFSLSQGLKSVQNSAAARGLGVSGAAMKGAANYATGLADSTYQNQFNNANINQTNAYNRLIGVSNLGENAAAMTGSIGQSGANSTVASNSNAGNGVANAQIGAGNAQAGAYMAEAKAFNGAVNQIPGAYYQYQQNPLTGASTYGSQYASNAANAAPGMFGPGF